MGNFTADFEPSGPKKGIALDFQQLRTILEICEAASELSDQDDNNATLKEAGIEAKNVLWEAIDNQDIAEMTRLTLEASAKGFERRKKAFKAQRRLNSLDDEFSRISSHKDLDGIPTDKLYRWSHAGAMIEYREPLQYLLVGEAAEDIRAERWKVANLIKKAKQVLNDYNESRGASKLLQADNCLEDAEVLIAEGCRKLQELMPVSLEECGLKKIMPEDTMVGGDWMIYEPSVNKSAVSEWDETPAGDEGMVDAESMVEDGSLFGDD